METILKELIELFETARRQPGVRTDEIAVVLVLATVIKTTAEAKAAEPEAKAEAKPVEPLMSIDPKRLAAIKKAQIVLGIVMQHDDGSELAFDALKDLEEAFG